MDEPAADSSPLLPAAVSVAVRAPASVSHPQDACQVSRPPADGWDVAAVTATPVGFWASSPPPGVVIPDAADNLMPPQPMLTGCRRVWALFVFFFQFIFCCLVEDTPIAVEREAPQPRRQFPVDPENAAFPWPSPTVLPSPALRLQLRRAAHLLVIIQDAIRHKRVDGQFVHYMGVSWCRLGCSGGVGADEFTCRGFRWPAGFAHYLRVHAVEPPASFLNMLWQVAADLRVTDATIDEDIAQLKAAESAPLRLFACTAEGARTGRGVAPMAQRSVLSGSCIAELPSGDLVIGVGTALSVWEPPSRIFPQQPYEPKIRLLDTHPASQYASVSALATLHDGRVVAALGGDGGIHVWSKPPVHLRRADTRPATTLRLHSGRVGALLVLRDGRVVSAGRDRTIRVWRLLPDNTAVVEATMQVDTHDIATWALAELRDGRIAATTETSQQCVRIWRLDARQPTGAACEAELAPRPLSPIMSSSNMPLFLIVLADGRIARVISFRDTVQLWTVNRDGAGGALETMHVPFPVVIPGANASISAACADAHGRLVVSYDIFVKRDTESSDFGGLALWRLIPGRGAVLDHVTAMLPRQVKSVFLLRGGTLASIHRHNAHRYPAALVLWDLPPPLP